MGFEFRFFYIKVIVYCVFLFMRVNLNRNVKEEVIKYELWVLEEEGFYFESGRSRGRGIG